MATRIISQESVKAHLDYDPITGELVWKISSKNGSYYKGDVVSSINNAGYLILSICSQVYLAHRIIYLHYHGEMPYEVDHKNGVKTDNRIFNLRAVTKQQNRMNQDKPISNTSGFKNVHFDKSKGKWIARGHNGRFGSIYLGKFDSAEEASLVSEDFCKKHQGDFYYKKWRV